MTEATSESVPDGSPTSSIRTNRPWSVDQLRKVINHIENLQSRHGHWACFLCCHVRTGTIVLGFWYMLLHLMALSVMAVMVVHPELMTRTATGSLDFYGEDHLLLSFQGDVQAVNCTEMPCSLATQGEKQLGAHGSFPLAIENWLPNHNWNKDQINLVLFITLCTFMITLLLVYGAFRGHPFYLMPFFFLQVFDFCISSMTMIGYLSYLPNVRQVIQGSPKFPFRDQLLEMDTKCLTFFVLLIFIVVFVAKAYCISIVWRCYKYLIMKSRTHDDTWMFRHFGSVLRNMDQDSQTYSGENFLLDYESAMHDYQFRKKSSYAFPEPPPSYDVAMAAAYTHEQETAHASIDQAQSSGNSSVPLLESAVDTSAQNRNINEENNRLISGITGNEEASSKRLTESLA